MATNLFKYHYNHYKAASQALSNPEGCEPTTFRRLDTIREAARTAIALEAGIIGVIPSNGRLEGEALRQTALYIREYEVNQS